MHEGFELGSFLPAHFFHFVGLQEVETAGLCEPGFPMPKMRVDPGANQSFGLGFRL